MKIVRDVVVDADHILYVVAMSSRHNVKFDKYEDGDDFGIKPDRKINLKPLKKHFKSIIQDYFDIACIEAMCHGWKIGKVKVILGEKDNFRYKISPEYKSNRKGLEKPDEFYALQKWARKKYICSDGCEADDMVAYYVRNGAMGFSTDKDILKSEGIWFDCYHSRRHWITNTKEDAYKFMLAQCLAGDVVDNIKGLPKVGITTAFKLLDEYGYSWKSVKKIYKDKGFTEKDALLTRSLIDMTLWHPKHGIKLITK
jgi:5'-3' exonuclease